MEQINTLLNLPEYATASDRACAVYELMQEHDNIQAARASAEHELMALRSATSHIFAESVCAARGITDADAQEDIRAAWCADPYAALNALAGENITAANPYGCNQYGHEWRGKHGEGWQPRGDRQNNKDKELSDLEKEQKGMKKANKDYEDAQEKYRQARKRVFDLDDEIEKARRSGNKEKESSLEQEQEKARKEWQKASEEANKATKAYSEQSKRYRAVKYGEKGKNLSDALKKIAPRTDKNGQGLMPFAGNKNKSMSDERAADMANEMFEIALEEGGYEKLYDTPKDKLKAVIAQELQSTPKEDADKLWNDSYDRYKWWRKNVEKVVKKL